MTEQYLYVQFYHCVKVTNQYGLNRETIRKLALKNSGTFTAVSVSHSHSGKDLKKTYEYTFNFRPNLKE